MAFFTLHTVIERTVGPPSTVMILENLIFINVNIIYRNSSGNKCFRPKTKHLVLLLVCELAFTVYKMRKDMKMVKKYKEKEVSMRIVYEILYH